MLNATQLSLADFEAKGGFYIDPALVLKAGQPVSYTSTTLTKLDPRRSLGAYAGQNTVGTLAKPKLAGENTCSIYNGYLIPVRVATGTVAASALAFAIAQGELTTNPAGEAIAVAGTNISIDGRGLYPLFNSAANCVLSGLNGDQYIICLRRD